MAYQGKFSQPRNTEENIRRRQEAERAAAAKAPTPASKAAEAAPAATPAAADAPKAAPRRVPAQTQAPATQPPVKKGGSGKKRRKKKGNRTVTLIFWTVYVVMVLSLCAAIFFANNWLQGWLVDYEKSQPTARCEEIFQEHFSNPDWKALYESAGLSDTSFEGADAFVTYMQERTQGQELTYVETSAGLSGGHKYLLKLGEETLGYFTLQDHAPEGADIPDWQLGNIVMHYSYAESVTIQKMDGQTVFVNGTALDDSYTVKVGTTLAEEYLPGGIHGPRIYTQKLSGLMREPVITAQDDAGNELQVTYDENSDIYIVQNEENTISDEEYARALATAKTYALRMIEKATKQDLGKYFDTSSQTYKTIVGIDPWMQEWFFKSYEWGQEQITGYYRYTEDLFSVHVKLPMLVTRTDGTEKEYLVDHSFFFDLQGKTWKCVTMTNVDVTEQTASVRLTFMHDDTEVFTNLFEEDITSFTAPLVTVPEGKVFAGWFRQDTAKDGSKTYTLVFAPDENGNVTLPSGTKLEPMTLYALFEDIPEGGNG